MNCLEIFCGTKSFGKCCNELGYNVISIDIEKQFNPTHLCDIMDFNYKQYDKDYFDIIWASPPCTEYSKAKSVGIRDIEGANKIVLKTIEIINYFNCKEWFIENPQTSLLKKQSFMNDYKYVDGDYCMYGLPYRKRTRIWTNKIYEEEPLQLCNKECGSFIDGRHIGSCGCGGQGQGHNKSYSNKSYSLLEKYAIPEELIYSLIMC
tara:strand:+ start:235 stop:852 length:618 start_codon:yes stop_codon:yes gene_type:complete